MPDKQMGSPPLEQNNARTHGNMDNLPNELISSIADTLNTDDFLSLYKTSRSMRKALSPQLWRQLTLGTCSKAGVVELSNSIPVEPCRYKRRICLNSKRAVRGFMEGLQNFAHLYVDDVLNSVRLLNLSITYDEHPSSPPQSMGLTSMYSNLVDKLELSSVEDIEVELYADEPDCKAIAELVFQKFPRVATRLSLGLRRGQGRMDSNTAFMKLPSQSGPSRSQPSSSAPPPPPQQQQRFELRELKIPKDLPMQEIRLYYLTVDQVLEVFEHGLPRSLQRLSIQQKVDTMDLKRLRMDKCPQLTKLSIEEALTLSAADWIPPTLRRLQYKEGSNVLQGEQLVPCDIPQVQALKVELSTGHSLDYMKFIKLQDLELEEGPWSADGAAVDRAIRNMIVPNVGSLSTLRFHDVGYHSILQLVENAKSARIRNLIILGCRDSFQYRDTGVMSHYLPHLRALVLDLPDRVSPAGSDHGAEDDDGHHGRNQSPPPRPQQPQQHTLYTNPYPQPTSPSTVATTAAASSCAFSDKPPSYSNNDFLNDTTTNVMMANGSGYGINSHDDDDHYNQQQQYFANYHDDGDDGSGGSGGSDDGSGGSMHGRLNHSDGLDQKFARFIYQFVVNCPHLANVYGVAWPDCFLSRHHRYFADLGPDILYGVSMRPMNLKLIRQEVENGFVY